MMSRVPAQRPTRSLFPEFGELFAGIPAWSHMRPVLEPNVMRLEEALGDGKYELRAEIPGVDPANDVEITVRDGRLTIKAHRTENKESNGRSEFSYGSFARSVSLPAGADEDTIKASYDKGILTVSVPVAEPKPAEKRIKVES
jgi:HSP20 family protein